VNKENKKDQSIMEVENKDNHPCKLREKGEKKEEEDTIQ